MNMSLLIPKGDNLVTYYILPLLNLSKNTFGKAHFKNSYLTKTGDKVFIELKSNMKSPIYKSNPLYESELIHNNTMFVIMKVPAWYIKDVKFFMSGEYSKMSKSAKNLIYKGSTLPYNKTMGDFKNSHPILQALDKRNTLRSFLVETFEMEINEQLELIDKPHESWYIESRIK